MNSTTLRPGICRSCGGSVPRTGPGRHPATCSPSCRRADRAAAARDRRRTAANPTPATPEPTEADRLAAAEELAASAARTRQQLRDRAAERSAAWDDLERGLAKLKDFYPSVTDGDDERLPRFDELGLSRVGPARGSHGRATVWESDGSHTARARRADREADDIRRACLDEALRAARITARARGVFELEDSDIITAQKTAEARADAILAAM